MSGSSIDPGGKGGVLRACVSQHSPFSLDLQSFKSLPSPALKNPLWGLLRARSGLGKAAGLLRISAASREVLLLLAIPGNALKKTVPVTSFT